MQQYNQTQGSLYPVYPSQRGTGLIQPPPPIPPRQSRNSVNQEPIGWVTAQAPIPQSPWGDNSSNRNSWNLGTNPFQDNFVMQNCPQVQTAHFPQTEIAPALPPKRNSLNNRNSSLLSETCGNRTSSNSECDSQQWKKSEPQSPPLITLSPSSTMEKKLQPTTYSMDLEGIDFSNVTEKTENKKTLSSSTEDMSVRKRQLYPDISQAFNEVRREEQFKQSSHLGSNLQNPMTYRYGWNPSIFNAQPTVAMNQGFVQNMRQTPNQPQFMGLNSHNTSGVVGNHLIPGNPFTSGASNFHIGAISGASNFLIQSGTDLQRVPSNSEFDNLRKIDLVSDIDAFTEKFESSDDLCSSQENRASDGSGDLMHFSESDEKEYMSVDFFDPLYSRTRRESVSTNDSSLSYSFFEAEENRTKSSTNVTETKSALYPSIQGDDSDFSRLAESADALEKFLQSRKPDEDSQKDKAKMPERPPPPRTSTYQEEGPYEKLHHHMFVDEESDAFCQMVAKIKSEFKSSDMAVNRGFVVSAVCDKQQPSLSIKIIIYSDYAQDPIHFTCDIHSNVEHIISNVLYSNLQQGDMSSSVSSEDFLLKVYDRSEYLLNHFPLSKYEYIHTCLKLDRDIQFELVRSQDITRPFLRTVDDDVQHLVFPKNYVKTDEGVVTRDQLETLMNTFYTEIEKMRDHILKKETIQIHSVGVVQTVKAICMMLAKIETVDVGSKLKRVEDIVKMLTSHQKQSVSNNQDKEMNMAIQISLIEELEEVLEQLLLAVNQLVKMYCKAFHTDFILGSPVRKDWSEKYVTLLDDDCLIQIASAHKIPSEWTNKYDGYKIICGLYHGKNKIGDDMVSKTSNDRGLCDSIVWDQWLSFKDVALNTLPRETRLCMTLCGLKGMPANNQNNPPAEMVMALGGVTLQLFSQKGYLIRGSHLVPLKMNSAADPFSPFCSVIQSDTVLLQINFPDFNQEVIFPDVLTSSLCNAKSFDQLLPDIQDIVYGVLEKDCITSCQADELGILWQYRHYLYEHSHLLPWILQGSNINWDYSSLSEVYALLRDWPTIEPMQALEILLPQYPDCKVREFAINCLKKISSDELADFLPQLVQALKYESYHASHLARLLLEQSCKSVRFAHQFFWLLKGAAAQDLTYKRRYELMFVALINVSGDPLYQEFRKQEEMVKILTTGAEKVQVAKDKEATLRREMDHLNEFFEERSNGSCLLPYNPGLAVSGIDLKSCSYFNSNAVPLKIVFKNPNIKAHPVYTMFKVGDDLRQDMLTMQMIRLMDRLWMKAGLDLKIITFACLATGPKKGIVEIVTESETLRKIQIQAGLTGSFKDRPIKEWLQGHNPTELEYQKAVENFTCSCAGYCVATYVLGVCDRHNDNIMLKQSGHMFHIDFNKFLGDSQMFGNIKRDRVPFVLTSDMAHVINNGEKRSDKFQHFIDLCCQAFNILRKNANLFLNLFALVSKSGIPGVSEGAARYIQRALLPGHTEAQASAVFTRMIEDSLKSVFTQFNFFIHNLAQLKFSSHQEGALLSFVPKTYSIHTDGKLQHVEVHGYQKRYQPDKHYIYIFKVQRVKQKVTSLIFRHFSEFVEFSNKLRDLFPLTPWPPPPSKYILGRSNIQTVAESRKVVIEKFLEELWTKAPEVCESDIVYTFFHPLLRDEQEAQKENLDLPKLRENPVQLVTQQSQFGLVKLSVHYKRDTLHVMVMHAKELPSNPDQPSPYVKTYLLPDPEKQTKRKTKIVKHSTHPTYNEVIDYKRSMDEIKSKTLQVSVWDHDMLKENNCLGAVYIKLRELDLTKEVAQWYKLEKIQITESSMLA